MPDFGSPAAVLPGGTMGELLIDALERYPTRIAFAESGRETTYAEFSAMVSRAIQMFRELGLRRGDVVAQLAGNHSEVYAVIAAVYISGLRSTTLHVMGSLEDHSYIVSHSGAKVLIVDAKRAERGAAIAAAVGGELKLFAHDDDSGSPNFWRASAHFPAERLTAQGEPEDIIRLAYTGGTTGKPKGVMLSNRALVTNTVLALAGHDWPEQPRFLCPTPISHGAGSFILPTLLKGGTFVLQDGFHADQVLDALRHDRISMTFLVPTMIYALLDHPQARDAAFPSLHSLLYGAAPMAPSRIREALDVLGPVLVQVYGQTECPNSILTLTRADHLSDSPGRLASAGRPYPGLRVRLLDDEGRPVERGQAGELCVRGPLVMSGYWKQPELDEDVFRDGWLHTGDMAFQDEDGFFHLVDRKKDVIISGGFNVYPGEVEQVLTSHPAVAAAGVIGIPDAKWGEAVKAVIVVRPNASVTADELIQLVRERKGPVNTPKSVDFVDALPLTALGKPDKKALRSRYWSGQGRNIN